MKDNYSWLDGVVDDYAVWVRNWQTKYISDKSIKDHTNHFKQTIISQIEIEKLRARIEQTEKLIMLAAIDDRNVDIELEQLQQKLKELEND